MSALAGSTDEATAPVGNKVIDPSGGANHIRVRAYNERLVLSLVRRHGELSKAEIARRSGLSAQTVSVIMRALEADGLLQRGDPVRGKVGQPSIPMRLDPDGVFSLGLKIGRRSTELVLMDFVGTIRLRRHHAYPYPSLAAILAFVKDGIAALSGTLPPEQMARICGLGVAMPGEIWNWAEAVGAPAEEREAWRQANVPQLLYDASGFPVFLENDATAACAAELIFGIGPQFSDFAYFFIGIFAGGGVVLNHELYPGKTGNAGAFGSMPIPAADPTGPTSRPRQLIDGASVLVLERMVQEAGRDASSIWRLPEEWDDFGPIMDEWISFTARSLAVAALTVCSVIDFEAVVIDGGFTPTIRKRLAEATRTALAALDHQGITRPRIEEGQIGSGARATGAASLPLFSRYLTDQTVLFKDMQTG
ncbi:ROK family transcriptional regulator [Radicibacter daui]|uniref:ROK family transcriptional regulator n=1 Tax=Radicibacter daui TaxID=3064829 RepID=UPI004046A186